jgi:heme-degrading monooxygenase HmoA
MRFALEAANPLMGGDRVAPEAIERENDLEFRVKARALKMMAVIFEVWPASGRKDDYLKMAAALKSEVEQIDGFISVERFESLYEEGKLLSLQFWRDDTAIAAWRNQLDHRKAQARGKAGMFRDYRLRIAQVMRDYGPNDRTQAPVD